MSNKNMGDVIVNFSLFKGDLKNLVLKLPL